VPQPSDVTVLRALAHPVRNRILAELSAQGSLRAADVAAALGIPANSASFHLRQLAKYGLVEEDPTAARDRRDRVWKAAEEDGFTFDLGEIEQQPGGEAASRVFRGQSARHAHALVEAVYADDRPRSTHRSVTDQALRLTEDEARALAEELQGVLAGWAERTRGHRDDGRRTYSVLLMVQAYPAGLTQPADGPGTEG
jgi:DNA-binding transcriptional ArsR family regulator